MCIPMIAVLFMAALIKVEIFCTKAPFVCRMERDTILVEARGPLVTPCLSLFVRAAVSGFVWEALRYRGEERL